MALNLREIARRLREARLAAGFKTAKQFADTHRIPQPTYAMHEGGQRGLRRDVAATYARLLDVSVEWLLTGKPASSVAQAVLRGYVGAGAEIHPFPDEGSLDVIDAPPGCEQGEAYLVRGDSMTPVYQDGDVIFPDPIETPSEYLDGRDCIVQIHNGARLVKRVHRGAAKGMVRLFSYATHSLSPEVRLEWARPIVWVRRQGG